MLRTRILSLITGLCLCVSTAAAVSAAEVDCDTQYCFSTADFSDQALAGICITGLPDAHMGTLTLGTRLLRPGDILTADQLSLVTFSPMRTKTDQEAALQYLPVFSDHVAPQEIMTISIRGKEDKAPVAEDSAGETYKNLPLEGSVKAKDPEGMSLTFTVTRNPRRGTVEIREDGSFTYTPRKNKVGVDSFTFTAADPNGNVSRVATVTVTIMKPTDAPQYQDTVGKSCRFAAEWMKNTGIFVGENLDGNACFQPEKPVTRGEFVAMLVKSLEIPRDAEATFTGYTDEIPTWLKPYLAAAVRSGLVAGLPASETFGAELPLTGGEAAVMLQNALDLSIPEDTSVMAENAQGSSRAELSLQVLSSHGICLDSYAPLTRAQAAEALYAAVKLSENAPGALLLKTVQ